MLLLYFSLFFDVIFLIFSLILIIRKSPVQKANQHLAYTFLLMSVCGFFLTYLNYAMDMQSYGLLRYYYPVSLIIVMFIGPFIYFYVKELFGYHISGLQKIMHALPALPAIVFVIYFALLPANIRIDWLIADYQKVRWQEYVINLLFYVQLVVYILLCIKMLNKHLKHSDFISVGNKHIDVSWLRYFFGISLSLFILKVIVCAWINSDRVNTLIGLFLMDLIFLYFFIHSVWKTGLLAQTYVDAPKVQTPSLKISNDTIDVYITTLYKIMTDSKIYLSENCTIDELAAYCQIPKHHLSHIINNKLDKTFSDFINEYRIKHACELIKNAKMQQLTIEAIGSECGFGSKASFYRSFKKHTGLTPSEYKQQTS